MPLRAKTAADIVAHIKIDEFHFSEISKTDIKINTHPAQLPLLKNITLELFEGKTVCLMGMSGTGKTTLLRLLAGLIPLPEKSHRLVPETETGRESIALLAQDTALLPWLNIIENVTIGDKLRGLPTDFETASSLLEKVGLQSSALQHPSELSGGMQQRTALARTLYEDTQLVLLDEPFSSLDALTRKEMQILTKELLKGKTVFIVSHDPYEALFMADELYILKENQLTKETLPTYHDDLSLYCASQTLTRKLLNEQ